MREISTCSGDHVHTAIFVSFRVSFSFGKSLFGVEKAHEKLTEKIRELLKKRCIGYFGDCRKNYGSRLSRRRQGFESPWGRQISHRYDREVGKRRLPCLFHIPIKGTKGVRAALNGRESDCRSISATPASNLPGNSEFLRCSGRC